LWAPQSKALPCCSINPLSEIRGGDLGWLKAKHHFAIGGHRNPAHHAVGNLFVLNDGEIAAKTGFPLHSHADVEIISYVRDGVVTHEDSLGNKGHAKAGDVQVMSAGTGIRHSEYNEQDVVARMFQIWLRPRRSGGQPRWDTRAFPKAGRLGSFVPLASGYGAAEALPLRADAEIYGALVKAGSVVTFDLPPGHSAYLIPATGVVRVGSERVEAREDLVITDEASNGIEAVEDSELVLIVTAALAPQPN
jgi:redox-sensitive bicupin YhaK (pirin superfamily)